MNVCKARYIVNEPAETNAWIIDTLIDLRVTETAFPDA